MVTSLLTALGAGLLIWVMVTSIRRNPEMLSATNVNKSLRTLGLLALFLIAVIALVVMLIKPR